MCFISLNNLLTQTRTKIIIKIIPDKGNRNLNVMIPDIVQI